jgi:hypothetical protein
LRRFSAAWLRARCRFSLFISRGSTTCDMLAQCASSR